MATSVPVQKHKLPPGQLSDEWSIREKLILASSVVRSGDQNWVSVSRAIKPVVETGCCARPRPPDFFSQKNCAIHYSEMLEKVSTPKRKRTNEGGGGETPGDQIVRKLTFERIEELKKSVKNDQILFRKLKDRIEDIRNGKLDHQLQALWNEIKIRKMMRPPPILQPEGDGSAPVTPTTPTTPVTPTTPGSQPESIHKHQGSQPPTSQQKGKQLRVPKPTPKFQKYQQLLHQRHSGHAAQSSPLNQTPEGLAVSPDKPPGDGGCSLGDLLGGQGIGPGQTAAFPTRAQFSKGEPMDMDAASSHPSSSQDFVCTVPPQLSPRRSDPVPQSPVKHQSASHPSLSSSQVSNESALVSLLSLPSSQDSKPTTRPVGDQEMLFAKDGERRPSLGGQPPQMAPPNTSPRSSPSLRGQTGSQTSNFENSEGKHFLGVAPSMEPKKLDSMREKQGNTAQTTEAPSVSAPTLSKLLADTPSAVASPALNSVPPHTSMSKSAGTVDSSALVESSAEAPVDHSVSVVGGGRGLTGGSQGILAVATSVPPISVNPKAALTATLPSPMAITPPPTTPPADRKEMIAVQKFEPTVRNSEKTSVPEVAGEALESKPSTPFEQVAIPEVKVEPSESPACSPRITKRAFKPGRPGRPPKGARRNSRNRTKSATSTDNEGEVEEEREEGSKFETLDVESEKASERTEDEDEGDSTADDKKDESDDNMELESGDEEALSESGERSQSEKDEPGPSMKEFLLERAGMVGSESIPGSPASQMSQGSSDEQEAIQAQKTWKKSIMLVWRAAANHKYANVFLHPVTDDEAPGYHSIVFRPMDLSTIKKNIENGTIRTTSEFQRDMMLMFQNALMYNSADHDVYRMAEEMRDDVMEQIQSYIATQIMVDSKMLRGHRQDVFHIFL